MRLKDQLRTGEAAKRQRKDSELDDRVIEWRIEDKGKVCRDEDEGKESGERIGVT